MIPLTCENTEFAVRTPWSRFTRSNKWNDLCFKCFFHLNSGLSEICVMLVMQQCFSKTPLHCQTGPKQRYKNCSETQRGTRLLLDHCNNVASPFLAEFWHQGSVPVLLCFTPHCRLSQIQESFKFSTRTIVSSFCWEFLQSGQNTSAQLFPQGKPTGSPCRPQHDNSFLSCLFWGFS